MQNNGKKSIRWRLGYAFIRVGFRLCVRKKLKGNSCTGYSIQDKGTTYSVNFDYKKKGGAE